MRILVLGGTRFLGKQVVNLLIREKEIEVIVLSRRGVKNFMGKELIISEKENGLRKLKGSYFDIVIDFIAYNLTSVKLVFEFIQFRKYIVISTCWLNKLNHSYKMNEIIENVDVESKSKLPEITREYLMGKNEIENFLAKEISHTNFAIIRLPIILGEGDHTKRLNFYVDRVRDGQGLILINNGQNHCQFVDFKLVAQVLVNYILDCLLRKGFLFEALPNYSVALKQLVSTVSSELKVPLKTISISSERLKESFPEYLEEEPFWRENIFTATDDNLFKMFGINVKQEFDEWFKGEIERIKTNEDIRNSKIRNSEISFLKSYF